MAQDSFKAVVLTQEDGETRYEIKELPTADLPGVKFVERESPLWCIRDPGKLGYRCYGSRPGDERQTERVM